MPDNVKISELTPALQIDDSAIFPHSQDNGGTNTTFGAPMTQIGAKVAEGLTFSNLNTTNKHLVGAINEVLANSHEYSTTEQIIGEWIDGSTLYEKTLQLTNVSMGTGWAVIGNITGIDKFISCSMQELVPGENDYGYTGLPAVYYYNSGNIALYNFLGGHMGSISGYVTVRYTKVSV